MNNYGSEEDKLKNENSPNKLSLNRSLTNISLDEQLIGKRMKNNTKNNLKSNQTDKNIERKKHKNNPYISYIKEKYLLSLGNMCRFEILLAFTIIIKFKFN